MNKDTSAEGEGTYAIVNRISGLPLDRKYRTKEQAEVDVDDLCRYWTERGFPTDPSEFAVMPEDQVDRSGGRVGRHKQRDYRLTMPAGMVRYPFPLRDGMTGYLTLPVDLTREEADRIIAMIATLPSAQVVE